MVYALMSKGAKLNISNNQDLTPVYYATPQMRKLFGLELAPVCKSSLGEVLNMDRGIERIPKVRKNPPVGLANKPQFAIFNVTILYILLHIG